MLHADYGVQDEPFKILSDRFKARTKRSKGTIAAPDDLLQVQIFSELRTVVSTCEHLEDAILRGGDTIDARASGGGRADVVIFRVLFGSLCSL